MNGETQVQPDAAPPRRTLRCPHCGGMVSRIARQPLDRLVSLVAPRKRYRCRSLGCGWSGTFPRD